jgi:hypothetical protein
MGHLLLWGGNRVYRALGTWYTLRGILSIVGISQ